MFLLGAVTVPMGYFTPAAAENSQKVFEIPASKVRAMTPDSKGAGQGLRPSTRHSLAHRGWQVTLEKP
jgi:hypothetical protein